MNININISDKTVAIINIILLAVIVVFVGLHLSGISFSIGSGSSMDPVFDSGCSIIFSQDYTDQTLEEGDVVTYYDENRDVYITHQINTKYESYDPETADHTIEPMSGSDNGQFVYDNGDSESKMMTEQPVSRTDEVAGETVYIMKGVGNNVLDPRLVTEDQIDRVVNENTYIELADNEDFCRDTGEAKLSQIDFKIHH